MDRKDIDQESKKEFSSKVNEQAGRTSKKEVLQTKHMTIDQKIAGMTLVTFSYPTL